MANYDYLLGKELEATKNKWGGFNRTSPRYQNDNLEKPKGRTADNLAKKYNIGQCL